MIAIISSLITAIVSVIGWFVMHFFNRRLRREEAQREIYYNLFDKTRSLSDSLLAFDIRINNDVSRLQTILSSNNAHGIQEDFVNEWYVIVSGMLNDIYIKGASIDGYLNYLELGGTSVGSDTMAYQAFKSICIDTKDTLFKITEKWINYVHLNGMDENQLRNLVNGTKEDLACIPEFNSCSNDILLLLYNENIAKPLKLKSREIEYLKNRRYVTENGIVDKRY